MVVYHGKFSAIVPLGQSRARWQGQWHWQYTPEERLYPSEKFSIATHYTMRGFRKELTGKNGHYLCNDVIWSIGSSTEKGRRLEAYIGLDGGRVNQYSTATHLVGGVIGCRGDLTKHISTELSIEFPLYAPSYLPKAAYTYFKLSFN